MPFGKETDPVEEGRKGGNARVANAKRAIDLLWSDWKGDFAEKYKEIMTKLAEDPEKVMTDGEKQFCDRYEKNLEFVTPKRAREDRDGNPDIPKGVTITNMSDEELRQIAESSD